MPIVNHNWQCLPKLNENLNLDSKSRNIPLFTIISGIKSYIFTKLIHLDFHWKNK